MVASTSWPWRLSFIFAGAPGGERGDEVQHRGRVGDRLALDLDQHVAGLDARLVGRAAAQHAGDQRAALARRA